ncbi:hypothetical protein L6164_019722 [Bauhinia variegata]|uniref:Uncharacterized protein n=1 Tax=Bauhinia variegata TaxID=167791 RepID=A0ACB9MSP4_BAUVA|nr:hypothetical protein L6164_019722 [Bauhinia variegata]
MGLVSWWKGKKSQPGAKSRRTRLLQQNQLRYLGRMVSRPASTSVFEFGSVAASADKVSLAGHCPVSEELEPCRWEIPPASDSDAPQFRVVLLGTCIASTVTLLLCGLFCKKFCLII